ncbi:MAG: TetR/AcrR family transcriptional regulator [Lutisporaceae bacterium]
MKERFESLSEEKQRKIINAAYKVFSTFGYKKASTNEIIAEAGISKGSLFHYFKSKKGLYFYLYELSMNLLSQKLYAYIDISEPDILKRIRNVTTAKLALIYQYPELFDFIKAVYLEQDMEVKHVIAEKNRDILSKSYQLLYSNLDVSLFREGIDSQMAAQTIYAVLEKWSESYIVQYKDKSVISILDTSLEKELDRYIDFFKRSFYKTTT